MNKNSAFSKFVESNRKSYESARENDPTFDYEVTEERYAEACLQRFKHTIGKTKIDKTMRISLISEVADLLDARPGEEIEYEISGLEIRFRKVTIPYQGYMIEDDIIKENILEYAAKKKMEVDEEAERKKLMANPKQSASYEDIKSQYLKERQSKK
jgi:hypothetical protein